MQESAIFLLIYKYKRFSFVFSMMNRIIFPYQWGREQRLYLHQKTSQSIIKITNSETNRNKLHFFVLMFVQYF